jgi:hypothetical protein
MRRTWLVIPAAVLAAAVVLSVTGGMPRAALAGSARPAAVTAGTAATIYACVSSTQHFTNVNVTAPAACPAGSYPVSWAGTVPGPSPSPSPTSTSPGPGSTPSPSPTPTSPPPSPSPGGTSGICTASGQNGTCGPYSYSPVVMSNGYDTYVTNNCWADPACNYVQTTTDPGNWSVTGSEPSEPGGNTPGNCANGVKSYPDVQQLTNNWTGSGWNGSGTYTDTPISGLTSLTSSFAESMPHNTSTVAQAAYDIWTNYSSDIMVWVDNVNRESGGATLLAASQAVGGQSFDVYRYGGAGGEIIFSLNGTGGTGTFANESSGTVDILGVLAWVQSRGYASGTTIGQVDFGWEICSTGGVSEKFAVTSYGISGG